MNDIGQDLLPHDGIVALVSAGIASAILYDRPSLLVIAALALYLVGTGLRIKSADVLAWRGRGARFDRLLAKSGMTTSQLKDLLRRRERPVVLEDLATILIVAAAVALAVRFGIAGFAVILLLIPVRRALRPGGS